MQKMGQRFWSDAKVVAASRAFVCVRLLTYESKVEAPLLEWVFTGRTGALENTVFSILDPDATRKLVRGGRSPDFVWRSPAEMAGAMTKIAARYPSRKVDARTLGLPVLADLRRAINVAACDDMPLAIVAGKTAATRARLAAAAATLAWSPKRQGALHWVIARSDELGPVGRKGFEGLLVVQADRFGTRGAVLASSARQTGMTTCLTDGLAAFAARGHLSTGQHIRSGRREGVRWKTEIPVTDPHSQRRR